MFQHSSILKLEWCIIIINIRVPEVPLVKIHKNNMSRTAKIIIAVAAILFIAGVLFFVYLKYFSVLKFGNVSNSTEKKSEVKIVNGVPKLFVSGKEMNSSAVNVYYYPPQGKNRGPAYRSAEWIAKMKALVDQAVGNNTKLILLNVWWSDLDKSTSRPKNIGNNFNFTPLDAVFDHAGKKGAYIIPIFTLFPFDPDWWLKENNFPPYNTGGKVCDFCETDSAGNAYNNASMNSSIAQRDFGGFVATVVDHYKNNSALAGWDMGIGATGEDGYGPNYIALKATNIDNLPKFKVPSGTYTDYSPFFEGKFKEWIAKKYSSDQKLQTMWNDKSVILASVSIPKPTEVFQVHSEELPPIFPDPTDIFAGAQSGTDGSEYLNAKGKDFYEFRNEMRRFDREYYASLIKKNDPSHILLLNGASDDLMKQNSLSDGIAFSMFGANGRETESQSFFFSTDIARRAVKAGKLAVISNERTCDGVWQKNGECEKPQQLSFIEKLGKAVKCTGGIFAPTVGLNAKDLYASNSWIPPVWFSDKSMAVAKKINNFDPTDDCACSMASEMYSESNCSASSQPGCELLAKTYTSLCGKQINLPSSSAKGNPGGLPPNPSATQQGNNANSPCGDGKCDEFEKSSGMCSQDCK
jgi:hypothetical protein